MMSLSHWGLLDIESWVPVVTFEGPAYADRVNGELTFSDWGHWIEEDKNKWRHDPRVPAPPGYWGDDPGYWGNDVHNNFMRSSMDEKG